MIGALVLSNLMYLVGAVVAIVALSLVVVLRHRRPKSVEANVKTFNRGLAALAPEGRSRQRPSPTVTVTGRVRPLPRPPVHGGDDEMRSEADTG